MIKCVVCELYGKHCMLMSIIFIHVSARALQAKKVSRD